MNDKVRCSTYQKDQIFSSFQNKTEFFETSIDDTSQLTSDWVRRFNYHQIYRAEKGNYEFI